MNTSKKDPIKEVLEFTIYDLMDDYEVESEVKEKIEIQKIPKKEKKADKTIKEIKTETATKINQLPRNAIWIESDDIRQIAGIIDKQILITNVIKTGKVIKKYPLNRRGRIGDLWISLTDFFNSHEIENIDNIFYIIPK